MSKLTFEFKPRKAIEAILYITERTKDTPTQMRVFKLLYLADKISLGKYGRFIFGETYCAMPHGPVPSNALDLLGIPQDAFELRKTDESEHPVIKPKRQANIDYLSVSDTESLDKALANFDDFSTPDLRALSHDEAWEKAWEQANAKQKGSSPMALELIVSLLDNREELLDYLENLNS
jgi:uncharacterized phage-associated protein